ncbi:MAG: DNA-directed RNA polymerase subunit H [Candidatus Proteinoplasmatales archaeon SG8-5]|nr:MAG: DNA-directed RNA polymerase subunit H [Candidatus Proteinoplasmatales archaeon SG8-5]
MITDVNVLEHDLVPEHHLVPVDDEEKILGNLNVGKDQLPKIRINDPCIKVLEEFYGDDEEIREGRLVRIVRLQTVAGLSVSYRVIVGG